MRQVTVTIPAWFAVVVTIMAAIPTLVGAGLTFFGIELLWCRYRKRFIYWRRKVEWHGNLSEHIA